MEAPLAGIEIVTITASIAGPVAAARLCDLGAHVVSVEAPAGDFLESAAPEWCARLRDRVETLVADLATKPGRAAINAALATADVLLSALPERTLESLRAADLPEAGRRAALIHVRIVAERDGRPAHDLTELARVGLLDPPTLPRAPYVELLAAERAVAAVLAALLTRARAQVEPSAAKTSGHAPTTAIYLADVATALAEPYVAGLTHPGGFLGGGFAGYAVYPSADGYVALAAAEPHLFERVCDVLFESGEFATLAAAFASQTGGVWARIAQERDLPLAIVT